MKSLRVVCWVIGSVALIVMIGGTHSALAQDVTATITGTVTDSKWRGSSGRDGHGEVGGTRGDLYSHYRRLGTLSPLAVAGGPLRIAR